MQQYFKTGKTIVIDDQYEEAKPLLDALLKNQIPFFYTQGKPNSDFPLPNTQIEDAQYYNLIFLDLNLDFKFAGSQLSNESEEKTFKGTHANILDTIVKNNNRSFILVIWSNEEENYRDEFLKIFQPAEKYKTSKIPYKIISLSKPDFFTSNSEGKYQFIIGKEEELKNKINIQLENLEGFKFLCEWDRVVSYSAGDTIDDFMSMVNHIENEENREIYLAKILTCISVAYSGKERYLELKNDQQKSDAVLHSLTQLLNDDLDRNVTLKKQSEFKKWSELNNITQIDVLKKEINSSLLNSKLLIYNPNKKDNTGTIYKSEITNEHREIYKQLLKKESPKPKTNSLEVYKKENNGNVPENINTFNDKISEFILDRLTPIQLNVTPACDISNGKDPFHRIVLGLIIPCTLFSSFDVSKEYIEKTPQFETKIFTHDCLKECIIVLDFRYFITVPKLELKMDNYIFTMRGNLVNDIQTRLAAHVSRLGVFNL
jgi:hypothetical protein